MTPTLEHPVHPPPLLAGVPSLLIPPCGHVAACLECLSHMIKAGVEGGNRATPLSLRCPICVAPIHDVVRAFT